MPDTAEDGRLRGSELRMLGRTEVGNLRGWEHQKLGTWEIRKLRNSISGINGNREINAPNENCAS